jgi:hypothetical protein
MHSVTSVLQYLDQIEKNEVGGARSTYGGEERVIQSFGGETWGKETTWKVQVYNVKWIFRKWDVGAWTESSWLGIGTGDGHL